MLTEQQLKNRKDGLGGSDAAAIVGASSYKTPYDIYLEKTEFKEDFVETPAQRRGRILEPLVRKLYEIKTGNQVTILKDTLHHKKYSFILGHVDGFVKSENVICEFKTANNFQKDNWGQEGSDEIPLTHRIQCAQYEAIMEVQRTDVGLLIGSEDYLNHLVKTIDQVDPYTIVDTPNFRIYHYYRSSSVEAKLIERERGFWNDHVMKRIPPLPQTQEDISSMFPQSDNTVLTAKDEDLDLIGRFNALKCILKEVEDEFSSIKIKNCTLMGSSSAIADTTGQKLLMWNNEKYSQFDAKDFKDSCPDLHSKFLKEKTRRVLRAKSDLYQQLHPERYQTYLKEYQDRFLRLN